VIKEIENLNWKNGFYRKDIGFRIIDKWELYQEISKEKNY
jgi:phosphoribosylamine-glycine ligase